MAIIDIIPNDMLEKAIYSIPGKIFNTWQVAEILSESEKDTVEELTNRSSYPWRGFIGRALKRYSVQTHNIDQMSSPDESPARWKKR